jgi:hypothetical protein
VITGWGGGKNIFDEVYAPDALWHLPDRDIHGVERFKRYLTPYINALPDLNATMASVNGGFPIAGYDELSVEEITDRLEGLSEAQIKQVRDHERRTKNRKSLMEQFDRKLNKVGS